MKKRRDSVRGFFPSVCLAMVMLFFLVGVTTPSYGEAPKEILVGGTISVTGPLSKIVGPFKKLALSWQELINEQGGIWVREYNKRLPIRFIIYDDKTGRIGLEGSAAAIESIEESIKSLKTFPTFGPGESPRTSITLCPSMARSRV